jgi:hypothetical protein
VAPKAGTNVLLVAGSLTLRADNLVANQNTSVAGTSFTGMLITGDGVNTAVPPTPLSVGSDGSPFAVRLGRTDGKTAVSSPQIPGAIEMFMSLKLNGAIFTDTQLAISPRFGFFQGVGPNQVYRVNSCVIGQQGECTPLNNTLAPLPSTQPTIQLTQPNQPDVEDLTITGAANEEIWRKPE